MFLEIFTRNIKTKYKSPICSKATFLVLISGLLSLVLPFIFAYKSKGFWIKRDVFYEQPDIRFKGEYILVATTSDNNIQSIITCSSFPQYEKIVGSLESCPIIKVREIDKNFDNKMDELDFHLQVNLPKQTHITSISVIIPLDYKIQSVCSLQMQSAIIYQTFLPVVVSEYSIVGDVILIQAAPINCHKQRKLNSFYNYSIIINENELNDYHMDTIITQYFRRNLTTKLSNIYTSFTPGHSGIFNIKLQARYPEHGISYTPGFWQIIKWAWIQYFAIYIIISWAIRKIKTYIFNRRLVLFYEDNPIKKDQ